VIYKDHNVIIGFLEKLESFLDEFDSLTILYVEWYLDNDRLDATELSSFIFDVSNESGSYSLIVESTKGTQFFHMQVVTYNFGQYNPNWHTHKTTHV